MNPPEVHAGQWKAAVHTGGEILTASAVEPGIELGLFGVPAGYTAPEIEGWLHDLIGVARETGRDDAVPRPIPALLHHGLTGLLFSHAQLWNRDGEPQPLSYAIVQVPGVIAFGWIGEASVTALVAGRPADLREVIVRDDEGREARAFELADAGEVDLRLEWMPQGGAPVVLEARWPGAAPAAAPAPAAAVQPAGTPPPAPVAPPSYEEGRAEGEAELTAATEPEFRDAIETSFEPHIAPATPVGSMEGIERETFHPFPGPDPSFFDPESEPLDLDAAASYEEALADFEPSGGHPHFEHEHGRGPEHEHAPRSPQTAPPVHESYAAAAHAGPIPPPALPAPAAPPAPVALATPAPAVEPHAATAAPERGPAAGVHVALQESAETVQETLEEEIPDAHAAGAPGATEEEARPSRLRRMFSRFAFWRRSPDAPAADETRLDIGDAEAPFDVPGVPDQVPPSPEPDHLTAQAVEVGAGAGAAAPLEAEEEILVGRMEPDVAPAATAPSAAEPAGPPQAGGLSAAERDVVEPRAAAAVVDAVPEHARTAPATSGAAVAQAAAAAAAPQSAAPEVPASGPQTQPVSRVRTPMRPDWPTAEELDRPVPLWKRPWAWAVLMAALFAGGWIIGHMNDERRAGAARGVRNVLRSVGLGGAHFEVMVNSVPQGAWISVGGEDLARRTPSSIELEPGEHEVTLSFSDLGAATFQVRGADGERLTLAPTLWGALQIYSSDQEVPVAVAVDGIPRGFAPLRVDSLAPGAHEVRFSGPGLPSWGQTVQVRVGESAELIARPMTSPATGVIEVRATMAGETGTVDVEGAQVWLDGRPAGRTPLTLELPRGPHSIRVEHLGETAPVQVIDLPGGNQRFASFMLRSGESFPSLATLDPPAVVPLDRPTVVSLALDGVQTSSLREMWLHVQTPDGPWRRYQMAWLKATGGVVGVAVFPTTLFDGEGRVRWYASASTQAGDEYFSEVQTTASPEARPAARR